MAQPGVSAQIRRLERELGQPLLDRTGGRVRPTEAGAARAALRPRRAELPPPTSGTRSDALTGLVRGHLSVPTVASISMLRAVPCPACWPPSTAATAASRSASPRPAPTGSSRRWAAGRFLDIALIVARRPSLPADVERPVVIVDRAGRRGRGARRPPAGRAHEHHPGRAERARPHRPARGAAACGPASTPPAAAAGLTLRVAFEAGDPHLLAELARRGLGAAVLPESVTMAYPAQLRAVPLARPRLRARIALAWRAQQPAGPAARAFINHARRQLARPGSAE